MEIKKTTEYFGMSIGELLESVNQGLYMVDTKEDYLLSREGNVTYFDDLAEFNFELESGEFLKWMNDKGWKIKVILETINERIAVVLVQIK